MSGSLRRQRRRFFVLISVPALALGLVACLPGADDKVSIGLVVPASGADEQVGIDMSRGFDLYLDQHGGKLGDRLVEVVNEDEGDRPETGVRAVTGLIEEDEVDAIVGIADPQTALAVQDVVVSNETPLIVTGTGADDYGDGSDYLWRTSFTNSGIGRSLGKAVAQETDRGAAYVVAADQPTHREFSDSFMITFEAAGGVVAGQRYTPPGSDDWRPLFDKMLASGATAVFASYAGAEAAEFLRQYRAAGISQKLPLYGPGFLTDGVALAAPGKTAVGVKTAFHYSEAMDTLMNDAFVKDYTKAYGAAPTAYSVQAYDAAAVLDKALTLSVDATREEIADSLSSIGTIVSPRGSWGFDPNHDPDQTYFMRVVKSSPEGPRNLVITAIDSGTGAD